MSDASLCNVSQLVAPNYSVSGALILAIPMGDQQCCIYKLWKAQFLLSFYFSEPDKLHYIVAKVYSQMYWLQRFWRVWLWAWRLLRAPKIVEKGTVTPGNQQEMRAFKQSNVRWWHPLHILIIYRKKLHVSLYFVNKIEIWIMPICRSFFWTTLWPPP